jgi:hypothetical protein
VTSSVKPLTDVSLPVSTAASTSSEITTPLSLAHELTLHLILLSQTTQSHFSLYILLCSVTQLLL